MFKSSREVGAVDRWGLPGCWGVKQRRKSHPHIAPRMGSRPRHRHHHLRRPMTGLPSSFRCTTTSNSSQPQHGASRESNSFGLHIQKESTLPLVLHQRGSYELSPTSPERPSPLERKPESLDRIARLFSTRRQPKTPIHGQRSMMVTPPHPTYSTTSHIILG
ncbi:hypothetical protein BDN72DRAFT_588895 [Pluteus cervinus]|uniref:Uncharacterized protein n=1 Tax=Pluteus cervinus TaxID=181527 RepID=A0ACD3A2B6_9AGAR|nr:hypothetical protein BDN72DRAFT_588895 [Pluteus cervinus]